MLLAQIAETSQQIAATSARRGKTALLAAALAQLTPDEVPVSVAFLAGEPRQGRIGIGYAALRSLAVEPARQPQLTLLEVDATLVQIAGVRGAGAQGERLRLLAALLARSTAIEQNYLQRLLLGELRQGALEGVLLDAIAQAYAVPPALVRRALMLTSDLGRVARVAREQGAAGLQAFRLQLFTPLAPMLAQSAADSDEALQKLGQAAFEWKLDGGRVQLHREGDQVRVWSRALNDVTAAVPELVEFALQLPSRSLVLDGEAIALAPDGRPRSFQTTMRRFGRKLDVPALRAELPLSAFFFDVLHADGEDVLDRPALERAAILAELLPESAALPRLVTGEPAAADAFVASALAAGHEGVVAKSLEGGYEAGRRGGAWLKIKRAHTLDLVVLAAEWGSGRRKGFLSNLHLGARGAAPGEFVMLGKTFKGMTDAMLAFQTRELLLREVERDAHTVYVRPELVVEVAFDGIQRSPQYPGGVALRFARIKGYRADKTAEGADTLATVLAVAGTPTTAPPPLESSE